MNLQDFNQFMSDFRSQLELLSASQRKQVLTELQAPSYPQGVLLRQQEMLKERRCIDCGKTGVIRSGIRHGLIRFRCQNKDCRRTFNALTDTSFSCLHMKEKWDEYIRCMEQRLTLQESARRCGISYRTAFKWRHRFLASARDEKPLEGIVEVDETYFLESSKGSRSLHKRRPPRKRGGGKQRGLGKGQCPVFTAVARGGSTAAELGQSTKLDIVKPWLQQRVSDDSVVITDAHRSYSAAAKQLGLHHEALNQLQGQRKRNHLHIQTVNQRHTVMKRYLNHHHRGVSTRYLNNYMNWFCGSEFRINKTQSPDFIAMSFNPIWLDAPLST